MAKKNRTPNPDFWTPEQAYSAANMGESVAKRLTSVLVLIQHVNKKPISARSDEDDWSLDSAADLLEACQRDLRTAIGGAR